MARSDGRPARTPRCVSRSTSRPPPGAGTRASRPSAQQDRFGIDRAARPGVLTDSVTASTSASAGQRLQERREHGLQLPGRRGRPRGRRARIGGRPGRDTARGRSPGRAPRRRSPRRPTSGSTRWPPAGAARPWRAGRPGRGTGRTSPTSRAAARLGRGRERPDPRQVDARPDDASTSGALAVGGEPEHRLRASGRASRSRSQSFGARTAGVGQRAGRRPAALAVEVGVADQAVLVRAGPGHQRGERRRRQPGERRDELGDPPLGRTASSDARHPGVTSRWPELGDRQQDHSIGHGASSGIAWHRDRGAWAFAGPASQGITVPGGRALPVQGACPGAGLRGISGASQDPVRKPLRSSRAIPSTKPGPRARRPPGPGRARGRRRRRRRRARPARGRPS